MARILQAPAVRTAAVLAALVQVFQDLRQPRMEAVAEVLEALTSPIEAAKALTASSSSDIRFDRQVGPHGDRTADYFIRRSGR